MIYLDETWVNARDSVEKMWVEDDPRAVGGTKGGLRKPSEKGGRMINCCTSTIFTINNYSIKSAFYTYGFFRVNRSGV